MYVSIGMIASHEHQSRSDIGQDYVGAYSRCPALKRFAACKAPLRRTS